MKSNPDWSSLLHDLLVDIATLVLKSQCAKDYIAFGGVCRSWRYAAKNDECLTLVKGLPPMLMIPEKYGEGDERKLYNLLKMKVNMRLLIPNGKDRRCIGSRFGWLLLLECSPDKEWEKIDLFNPFTGATISLPNIKTLPGSDYDHGTIKRSVLSADPSETLDYGLMVLTDLCLKYWSPGHKNWTDIVPEATKNLDRLIDVNYFEHSQRYYMIGITTTKLYFIECLEPKFEQIIFSVDGLGDIYLVESSTGDLLIVMQIKVYPSEFYVFHVDVTKKRIGEIVSTKYAIFVGQNPGFCLVPSLGAPRITNSNSIYFAGTLDCKLGIGTDTGVYNLEDRSFQNFHQHDERFCVTCPPLWIAPSSFLT